MGQSASAAEIRDLWARVDDIYQECVKRCLEMADIMAAGARQYNMTANPETREEGFNAVVAAAKDRLDSALYKTYYENSFRLADNIAEALKDFDSLSLAHNLGKPEPEVLALAELAKTPVTSRDVVLAKPEECFVDALNRNVGDLKRSQTES